MPVNGKSALSERSADAKPNDAVHPLAALVLARVACEGGATRSDIAADLAPIVSHKLSPGEWRNRAEANITALLAAGLASETRNRLRATDDGVKFSSQTFGWPPDEAPAWAALRDMHLIAQGLGIARESPARLKMAIRPEGLRALILQTAFKLPGKKNPSLSKLRAQLATVALERAFGNSVKQGFGKTAAFTSKSARSLAAHLSANPRDYGTDQQLITALAAEAVNAVHGDLEGLQAAILRNLGTSILAAEVAPSILTRLNPQFGAPARAPKLPPSAANDAGPPQTEAPENERPDPCTFATAVKLAASLTAEGWPGNRKAFISEVWHSIRKSQPGWQLTEIEFKCMLAQAHKLGQVVLASADLKDKKSMAALESSAIAYKNTVWHFVRVEEN